MNLLLVVSVISAIGRFSRDSVNGPYISCKIIKKYKGDVENMR